MRMGTKIFYGFMIFFGSIILALISNIDKIPEKNSYIFISTIFFGSLIILIIIEYMSWKKIFKFHKELSEDIINEKLDKIKEFKINDHISNK